MKKENIIITRIRPEKVSFNHKGSYIIDVECPRQINKKLLDLVDEAFGETFKITPHNVSICTMYEIIHIDWHSDACGRCIINSFSFVIDIR